MVNIVIAGLPKNVKVPKFISFLEKSIFGIKATLINTTLNGLVKSITLNMRSGEARKARRFLDGLAYPYGGKDYLLECYSEEVKPYANPRDRSHVDNHKVLPKNERYSRSPEHSKSYGIKEELERIDLRIDLLKKQRQLMAEENKLLLEKKKLEILQSIGPKDYERLANYEKVCYRNDPDEIAQLKVHSTPRTRRRNTNKLPNFNTPCKAILSEMNDVLSEYVNEENHDMLMSLIYSAIRKRIVIVLGGQTYMPSAELVQLYRKWYPQHTDNDLLNELTNTISQSCWPKQSENEENDDEIEYTEYADESDNMINETNEDMETNEELKIKEEVKANVEVKQNEEVKINEQVKTNEEIKTDDEVKTKEEVKTSEDEKTKEEVKTSEDEKTNEEMKPNEELEITKESETKDKTEIRKEPTSNETGVNTSVNEIPLKNLTNIYDFVDMENDLDEWDEEDYSKKELEEMLLSEVESN